MNKYEIRIIRIKKEINLAQKNKGMFWIIPSMIKNLKRQMKKARK